ncbi:hypothetical protein ACVXG9_21245 [Escherichia coli]
MALLIITTILWAFSLAFMASTLRGHVDSYLRCWCALAWRHSFFCRFCVPVAIAETVGLYMLVGAMQLGVMYMLVSAA